MDITNNLATVLVVDDEPQVLDAIRDSLEDEFHVITETSPHSAINLIKSNQHDISVILSDQRMPGLNGHEFLSTARELSDATRLLITGFSDLEAVIAAVNEGRIFGYVSKPWDPAALRLVIYKATEHHQLLQQLREREERFRQLAENIHDVFWMMSIDGKDIYVSPAYEKVWGRSIKSLLEKPECWLEAVYPEDRDKARLDIKKNLKISKVFDEEYRIVRPDSTIRWIHDQAFPVLNQAGEVYRYAGIARDITERKDNEQKIARLNRVYALLSGINSAIVRIQNQQALFEEVCQLAVEKGRFLLAWIGLHEPVTSSIPVLAQAGLFSGYTENSSFSTGEHMPDYCPLTAEVLRTGTPVICDDIGTDARMTPWKDQALARGFHSLVILPIMTENRPVGVLALYAAETGFFTAGEMKLLTELSGDISYALHNISQQEKLDYLAYYDPLTGLPNRSLFYDHLLYMLGKTKQNNNQVAVLVFDIKQFRHFNNTFGKQAGDSLLQEVALRLQKLVDDPANIARIIGDYFAMIITDIKDASGVAHLFEDKVLTAMSMPVVINNEKIHIDITGGIAIFPADGEDADTLYRHAEAALKKAKTSGQRYLYYQPEITARAGEALLLQNKLRHALRDEQFVLYYQPKVSTDKRGILGLEALIRWNDPESGLVPPGKFIPILEETGLILEVGNWAMEKALKDMQLWQSSGIKVPRIAVNVSAIQLQQKNFTDIVAAITERYGNKSCNLDLEVTESLLVQDIDININKLAAVRELGVETAIDDFGTGYSSLSYLAKLPVNAVKIDRSFIFTMDELPESMTIVSTIITLAHSMNFKVVAEGVETEEQAKLLTLLKCDEMQGFLFSKPLPPDAMFELLRSGRTL
jgi:diguanylate cyclase (GGDEF)-like protein/PAS domain S-box-containing protein